MLNAIFPTGWGHFLVGGLLIGAGVSLVFVVTGRVIGMSSVFSSSWSWFSRLPYFQGASLLASRNWRLLFALGLILGAAVWWIAFGPDHAVRTAVSWPRLLVGGLCVGFGTRLSGGCTSGHGICGLSSLSGSSLVAVAVFMAVAIATATGLTALSGGAS